MNTKQSSTGNVYGIYDLSGGAYEATAAYYNIATNQDLSNNGGELVRKNKQSSKYVTVYNSSILEEGYIIGDATYETKGWNGDHSSFVASNNPFFYTEEYKMEAVGREYLVLMDNLVIKIMDKVLESV